MKSIILTTTFFFAFANCILALPITPENNNPEAPIKVAVASHSNENVNSNRAQVVQLEDSEVINKEGQAKQITSILDIPKQVASYLNGAFVNNYNKVTLRPLQAPLKPFGDTSSFNAASNVTNSLIVSNTNLGPNVVAASKDAIIPFDSEAGIPLDNQVGLPPRNPIRRVINYKPSPFRPTNPTQVIAVFVDGTTEGPVAVPAEPEPQATEAVEVATEATEDAETTEDPDEEDEDSEVESRRTAIRS